jgi:Mu transposase, C-terminal domain
VIAVRAEADRAALRPLPAEPYLVADKHLRRVGKDCLISFEASFYSVPARRVRPGQQVQLRVGPDSVSIHSLTPGPDGQSVLAVHRRAQTRGSWVVDASHWDGLPDGHTRSTTTAPDDPRLPASAASSAAEPLPTMLARRAADQPVPARPLSVYADAAKEAQ